MRVNRTDRTNRRVRGTHVFGTSLGGSGGGGVIPGQIFYVTEDGNDNYVAENGANNYVTEESP